MFEEEDSEELMPFELLGMTLRITIVISGTRMWKKATKITGG